MKKPRPPSRIGRKRRTLGWTLLTLGVLVAGVWVGSWWTYLGGEWTWRFSSPPSRWQATVSRGEVRLYQPSRIGWGHRDYVFWPIPLLLWTPAALLLRSGILARRRAMSNACAKCGYSLAGLGDSAACPECGRRSMQMNADLKQPEADPAQTRHG